MTTKPSMNPMDAKLKDWRITLDSIRPLITPDIFERWQSRPPELLQQLADLREEVASFKPVGDTEQIVAQEKQRVALLEEINAVEKSLKEDPLEAFLVEKGSL